MKASRFLHLLVLLQTRQRMTTTELAERLEVSRRTVLRDVEALSMAGVPDYAERGATAGSCCSPVHGLMPRTWNLGSWRHCPSLVWTARISSASD